MGVCVENRMMWVEKEWSLTGDGLMDLLSCVMLMKVGKMIGRNFLIELLERNLLMLGSKFTL
jgi:hypothetical protein